MSLPPVLRIVLLLALLAAVYALGLELGMGQDGAVLGCVAAVTFALMLYVHKHRRF